MPAFDKAVLKSTAEAVRRYGLISPGDRILVAASGGKDSTVMAWALSALRPVLGVDYELYALRIRDDFSPPYDSGPLAALMEGWGIAFREEIVAVAGRLKEGRRMNCYWCATQRRTELIRAAMAGGFNKLALGHHLDDVLQTFLMNMLDKGELSTMPARLAYNKYPLTVIRPLALTEERLTAGLAEAAGFSSITCSCAFGSASRRLLARKRLEALTGGSGSAKRRMLESFSRVKADYLSGYVGP